METRDLVATGFKAYLFDAGSVLAQVGLGALAVGGVALIVGAACVTVETIFFSSVDQIPALVAYGSFAITCTTAGFAAYWLYRVAPGALAERGQRWKAWKERAAKAKDARARLAARGGYTDPQRNKAG